MEPTAITTIIVGVLTALIPALYTYLSGENRRVRAENKVLREQRDDRDGRLIEHRVEIRVHNDTFHPDGKHCVPLPALPKHMRSDVDDE